MIFGATNANAKNFAPMYLGVQGGFANTNLQLSDIHISSPFTAINSAELLTHVFGARAYIGYLWHDYYAIEAGYLYLGDSRISRINSNAIPDSRISMRAIDVRSKLFLPVIPILNFSPYLQAGVAYVLTNNNNNITATITSNGFGKTIRPLLGAGISRNITQDMSIDLSWTKITKGHGYLPTIDLLLLGISYRLEPLEQMDNANYGI